LPGSPHKSGNTTEAGSYTFIIPHVNHSTSLWQNFGGEKCELCNAGITAKFSQTMMNSCYEIKLALKLIITLNVQYVTCQESWQISMLNFDIKWNFFRRQKLWAVIKGIIMQELFWYYIVLVSDFHCAQSLTGLQITIHKQYMELFALCTWQTNIIIFTELHSHSTCPPF
jgi:hypothetical protein